MQSLSPPLGILGGTFDPIHLGHLGIAKEVHTQIHIEKIKLIPCNKPVHRDIPLVNSEHRVNMLQIACRNSPYLEVDTREIQRSGLSYTIDTLLDLRKDYPDTPLCLILGTDAFLGFTQWGQYNKILENAHLIIAHRPHYEIPMHGELHELLGKHQQSNPLFLFENIAGGVYFQNSTSIDIAASDIRNCVKAGKNLDSLLPEGVYNYIMQHQLYIE